MATDTDTTTRKIHEATTPPVRCSSCFGAYPERRFVDFGAAWDGPVLGEPDGVVGGARMVIDDLVICEECLRSGAQVLGMEDPGDTARHVDEVEAANEELREKLLGATRYIDTLEKAADARGRLETAIRGKG
jgi:hypothetical protein